jgi:cytochrome d ubiquinol oxidase subunit II
VLQTIVATASFDTSRSGLEIVWFVLIAVLWSGYFLLEGFDFGVGILLPVLGKDDTDRRLLINAIGPVWDGNEVWLLTAGGATFAAFPNWYATLFSGFYLPLFLILAALIFRGVAFEYRGKRPSSQWRQWWDVAIFGGSLLPALLWGVAFANILKGVPIGPHSSYLGSFFNLLNPYALVGGVTTLLLFTLHGAVFASLKTTDDLRVRSRKVASWLAVPTTVVVVAFLTWTYLNAHRIHDTGLVPPIVPVLAIAAVAVVSWLLREKFEMWAFVATGIAIVALVATIFLNLFPRVMVSSISPAYDLTIGNSASAPYTLKVMTIVACIFTPLVLLYQGWSYYVFRQRLHRPPATADSGPVTGSTGDGGQVAVAVGPAAAVDAPTLDSTGGPTGTADGDGQA